jgi:Ca2+-binding EF-hand superfamily protein
VSIAQICDGDTNGDGLVNIDDLIAVIQRWDFGCPPAPEFCEADLDGDGLVDINDLLEIVNGWGMCQ